MEIYTYNDGFFSIWLESDSVVFDDYDLNNSFMNVKLIINNSISIGLNVWSINYLILQIDEYNKNLTHEVFYLPDIIVRNLYKLSIIKVITELLNNGKKW